MNIYLSRTWIMVAIVALISLALVLAGALPALSQQANGATELDSNISLSATVAESITYQGRLTDNNGQPLTGSFTMRFFLYNAAVGGSALFDSGNLMVSVSDGLFTVALPIPQSRFDGQALWLGINVQDQTLSPRQPVMPAPYALGLRPGATIVGDSIGASGAILGGYAPATGTALYADAKGGVGLWGVSADNHGVVGASNTSWGGYFSSIGGYGIRVSTSGTDHYDHGAYVTSQRGFGVYAQSALNQGVRGEAGNVAGIAQPLGAVGVVGIGANRGTYGSSSSGVGLYGASSSNYGVWGQSSDWRGVTGRTSRADNNYGFYTPDNLYSLNLNLAGAIMKVMQNGGSEPLAPGDVVVFRGIDRKLTSAVDGPIVQVGKANLANSMAVAGVVFSRFNLDAIDPSLESPDDTGNGHLAKVQVTPSGDALPGEYVLVVVEGPAQVKASALGGGSIQPGDLLSASGDAGVASKAALVTLGGVEMPIPGTVFAKALEPVTGKEEMIYVYVTLQ